MTKLFFLILCFYACSFKPPEEGGGKSDASRLEAIMDSDGDGTIDTVEVTMGRNPLIADVPTFNGDMFQEIKVVTSLYRASDNSTVSASFQVKKDLVSENGVPYEERDFLGKNTTFLQEELAREAKESNFQRFHLTNDESDLSTYYSPPRMNDLKIFPFSEKILSHSLTHQYEEIEISILGKLSFKSNDYFNYSDIVYELYHFDQLDGKFSLLGVDTLQGVYGFNKSYDVGLTFKNNTKSLVKKISDSGGRFIYLRIRDLKIVDNGKFYKEIMDKVKAKSISVNVVSDEYLDQYFVGINSINASMDRILNIALGDNFKVSSGKIIQVKDKSDSQTIERNAYGESEKIENKWFLLTNEIVNTPFRYSFSVKDSLTLGFVSRGERFNLIPHYTSFSAKAGPEKTLKIFKVKSENIKDFRFNIKPIFFNGAVTKGTTQTTCGYSVNSEKCWVYISEMQSLQGLLALPAISLVNISLNDKVFRLDHLISSGHVVFRQKNREIFEFKFSESINGLIQGDKGLTLSISSKTPDTTSCEGMKICEAGSGACGDFFKNSIPSCDSPIVESPNFKMIDKTVKKNQPYNAEVFISVESF